MYVIHVDRTMDFLFLIVVNASSIFVLYALKTGLAILKHLLFF